MKNLYYNEFQYFLDTIKSEILNFLNTIKIEDYYDVVKLIYDCEEKGGRLHITGVGKPSHVAAYASAILSSTGTPTYILNCTEAVHGSLGQVLPGDIVLAISNSGNTLEMKNTIMNLKNNGAKIVGISGNSKSWLANASDEFLYAGVIEEGGPLNRAPRSSIIIEIIVIQALSILLQCNKGLTPSQYVRWHPSGALGKLGEGEKYI